MNAFIEWAAQALPLEQGALLRRITKIILVLLLALLGYLSLKQAENRRRKKSLLAQAKDQIGETLNAAGTYEDKRIWLSKRGAWYLFRRDIMPEEYYLLKLLLAILLGGVCFAVKGLWFAIGGGVVGFFLPTGLLLLSDASDNEKLIYDVKIIFDTLKIKTQAGMFLTTAITECYRQVRVRRLKAALLAMNTELVAKNDIASAVEHLQERFHNRYIDSLCVTLRQSLDSGKTVDAISDMQNQLTDMQLVINQKQKRRLDTKIQLIQLLIYGAILLIIVYGVFVMFGDMELSFA